MKRTRTRSAIIYLALGVTLGACTSRSPTGETAECAAKLAAGDLVITEVMANPSGSDTGKEWFEVRNTRASALDLTGLQIIAEKNDSTGAMTHTVSDQSIATDAYLVFGGASPMPKPDYVDYDYGNDLGALRNDAGQIILKCGTVVVAVAIYETTTDGASWSFDGTSWCDAQTPFAGGDKGSPGAANEPCGPTSTDGTCLDGGTARPIVSPAPGDLVITEILANPTGSDTGKEWFEVLVNADVDLNGLTLGAVAGTPLQTLASPSCLAVTAGSYLVFAHNDGSADDGGLPREDFHFTFDLVNSNRGLFIGAGDAVIDAVTYTATTEGVASSLDPDRLDADENDDPTSWCPAVAAYGAGDLGTPGTANPSCTPQGGDLCLDADGVTMRPIVAPAVGDLLITEVMPNPATSSESGKEWFEVLVGKDVDLAGLSVASGAKSTTFSTTDCQRVAAGTFLVFANGAPATSMLPRSDYTFNFTLVNSSSQVSVLVGGQLLDSASWTSTTDATSRTLKKSKFDTVSNDTAANFCNSTATYGDGTNHGTPGADDPSCG
jgi:Lamin Tail Domain